MSLNVVAEIEETLTLGAAMSKVLDKLIRKFNENPARPDIGMVVIEADQALADWKRHTQIGRGPKMEEATCHIAIEK